MVVPHGFAQGFFKGDFFAQKIAGVAAGIAQERPADQLFGNAVLLFVVAHFERVVPVERAFEEAFFHIKRKQARGDFDHAAYGVQLGAGGKGFFYALVRADFFGDLGILHAGVIAVAQQKALGARHAERFD